MRQTKWWELFGLLRWCVVKLAGPPLVVDVACRLAASSSVDLSATVPPTRSGSGIKARFSSPCSCLLSVFETVGNPRRRRGRLPPSGVACRLIFRRRNSASFRHTSIFCLPYARSVFFELAEWMVVAGAPAA